MTDAEKADRFLKTELDRISRAIAGSEQRDAFMSGLYTGFQLATMCTAIQFFGRSKE